MCVTGLCCVIAVGLGAAHVSDNPVPTPTPSPVLRVTNLGDAAACIELDRDAVALGDGPIVINDRNLAELAARGKLTSGRTGAWAGDGPPAAAPSADELATRRRKWRARYRKQQEKVRALEDRVTALVQRVELLEDSYFSTSRVSRRSESTRLKLEKAKQERASLEGQLRRERSELERVIREARREGAQPGWFR